MLLNNIKEKFFNIKNIITILIISLLIFIVRYILLYLGYPPNISFVLFYFFKGIKTILNSLSDDSNIFIYLENKINNLNSFNINNNHKNFKNLHIFFMDIEKIEEFQKVPTISQANPDNK